MSLDVIARDIAPPELRNRPRFQASQSVSANSKRRRTVVLHFDEVARMIGSPVQVKVPAIQFGLFERLELSWNRPPAKLTRFVDLL